VAVIPVRRLAFAGVAGVVLAFGCVVAVVLALVRDVPAPIVPPKNLLLVAPDEANEALAPLVARRRRQGFVVQAITPDAALSQPPLPFTSGYALLIGNPYLPPGHPYRIPTESYMATRVYLRRAVATGFPVGRRGYVIRSDRCFVTKTLGDFVVGRFPATELAHVQAAVARTLAYDDLFAAPRQRCLLVFDESGGFSPLIDGVLEGTAKGLARLFAPQGTTMERLAGGTDVVARLERGFDVAAGFGHGSPDAIGRNLISVAQIPPTGPRGCSGPLLLSACNTGFQRPGDLSERLFAGPEGPSHVLFASAPTHPYGEFLTYIALLRLADADAPPTVGAWLAGGWAAARRDGGALRRLADVLAWLFVGLEATDLAGLRSDLGLMQNLYGDPTQPLGLAAASRAGSTEHGSDRITDGTE